MEIFKQKLRNRLIFAGIYCAIILILIFVAGYIGLNDSATSFALGFGVGIEAVMIFFIVKCIIALKSEDKLKKLYIEEHDERQKHLNAMVGGAGINISILFLALAMLISNYFNQTVFLTLLAVIMFVILLKLTLKIYYNKKV